jgi:hypothetical protein
VARLRFVGLRGCGVLGVLVGLASAGCAARQVPPGPDPEYQRPELVPWEGAQTAEDPLSNIEDEGEWVGRCGGRGQSSPKPPAADPKPEPKPNPAPSAEPNPAPSAEPNPAPSAEPNPAPSAEPNPAPSSAPKTPQTP